MSKKQELVDKALRGEVPTQHWYAPPTNAEANYIIFMYLCIIVAVGVSIYLWGM